MLDSNKYNQKRTFDDKLNSRYILGVRVDYGLTMDDVLDFVEGKLLVDGQHHQICTTNPEFVMLCQKHPDFKNIINNSSLSLPDGSGLLYANYYLNLADEYKRKMDKKNINPIIGLYLGLNTVYSSYSNREKFEQSIRGVELTRVICKLSDQKKYSIFFLGGWPRNKFGKNISEYSDIAIKASEKIKENYPNANIIGSTSQFSYKEEDDKKTIQYIRDCMKMHKVDTLDFVFVAYNQYDQQRWIERNISKIPCKIGVGIGRTFEYLAGHIKEPNDLVYKMNLSWLFSALQQPWRIKRIFNAFPVFPLRVFIDSLK